MIVQLPGIDQTPMMTLSECIGIAQAGKMEDVIVLFSDAGGNIHVAWSKQTHKDLAAASLALSKIAAEKVLE